MFTHRSMLRAYFFSDRGVILKLFRRCRRKYNLVPYYSSYVAQRGTPYIVARDCRS